MSIDYVARTAAGAIIATFAARDQALAWAEQEGPRFPGWTIAKVERVTVVKSVTIRRDRPQTQSHGVAA